MTGFSGEKACFIMSDSWEKITARILKELDRGVTLMDARGAFTRRERPVVLCVTSRQEVMHVKGIVRDEDASAFMFVTEAHEALGEGFKRLTEE